MISPGTILLEDHIIPTGLDIKELSFQLGMYHWDLESIIKGDKQITPEIAIIFACAFGTTSLYWMSLQREYNKLRIVK